MYFDIEKLDGPLSYKLLTATVVPRPIAWVVSADAQGTVNAAPYSFFNFFGGFPPVVCIGIGRSHGRGRPERKDTLANIQAGGDFVVNLVPEELVQAMNITATDFPPAWSELEAAGLETMPSEKVKPPRIARSPVAIECRLRQVLEIDTTGHLVLGHVVAVHVRDEAVVNAERCYIDSAKLNLVGRMQSPSGYIHTADTFKLVQMDFATWQASQAKDEA
jgi:flavin reductase (DIM6/NTAB) family NADH-FMN oxidoreductase RutF